MIDRTANSCRVVFVAAMCTVGVLLARHAHTALGAAGADGGARAQNHPTSRDAKNDRDWQPLFNGKDLTGWKGLVGNPVTRARMSPAQLAQAQAAADELMRAHWKVENGVLTFDGRGHSICTAKDYADFELRVDWKIQPGGDSGIYLRGSPQVQIWDPSRWPEGSGGLYNNQKNPSKPLVRADRPVGEWNAFHIRMVGERVAVHLNDVLVVDNVVLENYWERDKPIYPTGQIELQSHGSRLYFKNIMIRELAPPVPRGYGIPLIDLADQKHRQVVVDREKGQYLGHPTSVLLEDNKTMIVVYPKGHGRGPIVMKRSRDAGLTWSQRLPVPDNWATSREVPTIHRVIDRLGVRRLIMFSGLYPIRMAVSEDDGVNWTPLKPIGDFGGIVAMASVERLANGDYVALFHDDGRFLRAGGKRTDTMKLFQTFSKDGGLTWGPPQLIYQNSHIHLCEPGLIRSPDGKQLAILLRENRRRRNSHVMFSNDEAKTWTEPRELPGALTGDRHTGKYAPDSRLFISFRDTTLDSPTQGDWVGWVGTYEDIVAGREGQYRVRLMDNKHRWDCGYPGAEVLPDGTFVVTTYGHWIEGEQPFVVSVRLRLNEIDASAKLARP